MGLAWQQGPLAKTAVGHFLSSQPLPQRLLFAEPLRRRMRVRFGGKWICDSEDVILLHEPGRYPVAYFPEQHISTGVLVPESRATTHPDFGEVRWFTVMTDDRAVEHAAWQYLRLPEFAAKLEGRVAFAWRAMDAFYEEDERVVGHAADPYHRIDIRSTSRHLVAYADDQIIADTRHPVVLYESGFAPRWYVPREDVCDTALEPVEGQTFCPYKGLASYYNVRARKRAAWSYTNAWPEVGRVSNLVSFEPDKLVIQLDRVRLRPEPGQTVVPHGVDRGLDPDEIVNHRAVAGVE